MPVVIFNFISADLTLALREHLVNDCPFFLSFYFSEMVGARPLLCEMHFSGVHT